MTNEDQLGYSALASVVAFEEFREAERDEFVSWTPMADTKLLSDVSRPQLANPLQESTQAFETQMTVLTLADRQADAMHPIVRPGDDHSCLIEGNYAALDASDQEPAVGKHIEQVTHQRGLTGHRVQGGAAPLETGLGQRISIYHQIAAWHVRHAGWLLFRGAVQRSTDATSTLVLRGKHYRGVSTGIDEGVRLRVPGEQRLEADDQWRREVWIDRTDRCDEYLVDNARGTP